MAGDIRYLACNTPTSMATDGTDDEWLVSIPEEGKFRLEAATFTPATALAIDGTNNATLTLNKGAAGTEIASVTTDTGGTALVKGTPIVFSLGAGSVVELDGQDDAIEIAKTTGGTGGVVEGVFAFKLRKVQV